MTEEQGDLFTFGAWSQDCSFDSIGLEASLEGVIPKSYYTIFSTRHKSLQGRQCCHILSCNYASLFANATVRINVTPHFC